MDQLALANEGAFDRCFNNELVALVSHDLATSASIISGLTELLLNTDGDRDADNVSAIALGLAGGLSPQQWRSVLQEIHDESRRLAQLMRDLVSARAADRELVLRLAPLSVDALVASTTRRFSHQLVPAREVHIELPARPCRLVADAERLQQVLINLLQNAVKYSPDGGPIHVRLQRNRDGLCLSVEDAGIGVPPEYRERIFERCSRAANSRRRQISGHGLGLFICRQIVEAHGGRIWADSPGEGHGTVVTLWLPSPRPRAKAARYAALASRHSAG